jgi:hypothetical protein
MNELFPHVAVSPALEVTTAIDAAQAATATAGTGGGEVGASASAAASASASASALASQPIVAIPSTSLASRLLQMYHQRQRTGAYSGPNAEEDEEREQALKRARKVRDHRHRSCAVVEVVPVSHLQTSTAASWWCEDSAGGVCVRAVAATHCLCSTGGMPRVHSRLCNSCFFIGTFVCRARGFSSSAS